MNQFLTLNTALTLSLVMNFLIPGISSLVAKSHAIAGIVTPILTAANGFFTEWSLSSDSHHYMWQSALGWAVLSYLIATGARYGLWKNTAVDKALIAFPRPVPLGSDSTAP